MRGGRYGYELLLIIPLMPIVGAASLAADALSSLQKKTLDLQQNYVFMSSAANRIAILKSKLAVMRLASNESIARIHAEISVLQTTMGEVKEAEVNINKALELVPNHYLYHYFHALLLGKRDGRSAFVTKLDFIVNNGKNYSGNFGFDVLPNQQEELQQEQQEEAASSHEQLELKQKATKSDTQHTLLDYVEPPKSSAKRLLHGISDTLESWSSSIVSGRDSAASSVVEHLPSITGHTHNAMKQRKIENASFDKLMEAISKITPASIANTAAHIALGERRYKDALNYYQIAMKYSSSESSSKHKKGSSNNSSGSGLAAATVQLNCALCHFYTYEFEQAIPHCDKAIELCKAAAKVKPLKDNEETTEEQAAIMQTLLQTLDIKSNCCSFTGKQQESDKCIEEALQLSPTFKRKFHLLLLPNDLIVKVFQFFHPFEVPKLKRICYYLKQLLDTSDAINYCSAGFNCLPASWRQHPKSVVHFFTDGHFIFEGEPVAFTNLRKITFLGSILNTNRPICIAPNITRLDCVAFENTYGNLTSFQFEEHVTIGVLDLRNHTYPYTDKTYYECIFKLNKIEKVIFNANILPYVQTELVPLLDEFNIKYEFKMPTIPDNYK